MIINCLIGAIVPTSSRILDGFLTVGIFLFGVCIGSFLNAVIYRLPDESPEGYSDGPAPMPAKRALGGEKSLLKKMEGRSFCPYCKHKLSWKDLFPVFSFLLLGGKCRYCHKKISIQYPLVEIATGIVFVSIFWSLRFIWDLGFGIWDFVEMCFMFYIASALIVIFVYDLKHYEIPDKVLFPAIGITFLFQAVTSGSLILNYLLAVLIAAGFFFVIFWFSKGMWMGFGDVKLAVLMGLLLGYPNILSALFVAFFLGAIIGVILMLLKKKGLKSEIPFGPFLVLGTFLALFWGSQLVNWYLHLFLF